MAASPGIGAPRDAFGAAPNYVSDSPNALVSVPFEAVERRTTTAAERASRRGFFSPAYVDRARNLTPTRETPAQIPSAGVQARAPGSRPEGELPLASRGQNTSAELAGGHCGCEGALPAKPIGVSFSSECTCGELGPHVPSDYVLLDTQAKIANPPGTNSPLQNTIDSVILGSGSGAAVDSSRELADWMASNTSTIDHHVDLRAANQINPSPVDGSRPRAQAAAPPTRQIPTAHRYGPSSSFEENLTALAKVFAQRLSERSPIAYVNSSEIESMIPHGMDTRSEWFAPVFERGDALVLGTEQRGPTAPGKSPPSTAWQARATLGMRPGDKLVATIHTHIASPDFSDDDLHAGDTLMVPMALVTPLAKQLKIYYPSSKSIVEWPLAIYKESSFTAATHKRAVARAPYAKSGLTAGQPLPGAVERSLHRGHHLQDLQFHTRYVEDHREITISDVVDDWLRKTFGNGVANAAQLAADFVTLLSYVKTVQDAIPMIRDWLGLSPAQTFTAESALSREVSNVVIEVNRLEQMLADADKEFTLVILDAMLSNARYAAEVATDHVVTTGQPFNYAPLDNGDMATHLLADILAEDILAYKFHFFSREFTDASLNWPVTTTEGDSNAIFGKADVTEGGSDTNLPEWRRVIQRPALPTSYYASDGGSSTRVFEWRMALPYLLAGITYRMEFLAATHFDLKQTSDPLIKYEILRYHDALETLLGLMDLSIECADSLWLVPGKEGTYVYRAICADIYTGMTGVAEQKGTVTGNLWFDGMRQLHEAMGSNQTVNLSADTQSAMFSEGTQSLMHYWSATATYGIDPWYYSDYWIFSYPPFPYFSFGEPGIYVIWWPVHLNDKTNVLMQINRGKPPSEWDEFWHSFPTDPVFSDAVNFGKDDAFNLLRQKMGMFEIRRMIDSLFQLAWNLPPPQNNDTMQIPNITNRVIEAQPFWWGLLQGIPPEFGATFHLADSAPGDSNQSWTYDAKTGQIVSTLGFGWSPPPNSCMDVPGGSRYAKSPFALPCVGGDSQRWTYVYESGAFLNALGTILGTFNNSTDASATLMMMPAYQMNTGMATGDSQVWGVFPAFLRAKGYI